MTTVEVFTDSYPSEFSWEIQLVSDGTVVASSATTEPFTEAGTTYSTQVALEHKAYRFVANDTYGDGICCNNGQGFYRVVTQGQELLRGGNFGFSESHSFTIAEQLPPAPPAPPPARPPRSPVSAFTSQQKALESMQETITNLMRLHSEASAEKMPAGPK